MRQVGIWTSPTEFRPIDRGPGTLFEELATRDRSPDFFSIAMSLPDPDPVLRKLGKDIKVYKELLADARVGPCVESRKAAVVSLEWAVSRGDAPAAQAKFVAKCLARLDVGSIIREILNAPLFGMAPLEVVWRRDGAATVPDKVVGKPIEWFTFDPENTLRLRTKTNLLQGEVLPEKKFLAPRYNATYDNPYGERVLSRCFWPVAFKKGGLKFWLRFIEKFGSPWIIGKHPAQADKAAIRDLADALERAVQDAVLVIPEGSSADIVEAAGKAGSSSLYKDLKATCDEDIAICILGQNLTTSVSGGSRAAAEVHERVRGEIKDGDKKIVAQTMATLIDWICELNFGPGDARPVFEMFEEEEVDQALATRDKTLVDTGQVVFTKKYFMKAYDLDDEDFEVVEDAEDKAEAKPAEFREGAPDIGGVAELPPEMLQGIAGKLLAPVIDLVESAGSVEDIADRLHGVYPDMDDETFEDLLTRAIFISAVWGRLSAKADAK
jgi:phage gp29-like protein